MKGRITLGTLGIGLLVALFLIAGCTSNKPEPKSGLVKELVDSVGSAFVQNVLETARVPGTIVHSYEIWPVSQQEATQDWQPEESSPLIRVMAPRVRDLVRQQRSRQ